MAGEGAVVVGRMKLGSQGLEVSRQGLGCMGMSFQYGPPKPEPDMIALIHHAVRSGVTFLDTSDLYGPFTNELLLGKALKEGVREKVELATKFGIRLADGKREIRGDPAYVRAACEASLKRLDVDCIDLYYQHRIDTRIPIEVTICHCYARYNVATSPYHPDLTLSSTHAASTLDTCGFVSPYTPHHWITLSLVISISCLYVINIHRFPDTSFSTAFDIFSIQSSCLIHIPSFQTHPSMFQYEFEGGARVSIVRLSIVFLMYGHGQ